MGFIKFFILQIFIFGEISQALADVQYSKPIAKELITNIPQTMTSAWNMSFNAKTDTLWVWSGIISTTALFYIYDEEILAEFQRWGRDLGLGNDDNTKDMIRIGSINIFRGPTDAGSYLYFLGDGWTHFAIGSSFLINGAISKDNRAMQTGSQIFHGMITSTIANQALKRSFGRESPIRKSKERGAWRPFPSISTYNKDISKYDAMPTGHLMTATMSYTIIDQNYPEYRAWSRPLGLALLTALGFQMINNSVHWISDYPLGIAMGYVFGKTVTQYGKNSTDMQAQWEIVPIYISNSKVRKFGVLGSINY